MGDTMNEIMNPSAYQKHAAFPHAPEGWTRESASAVAQAEGIELGDDLWDLIGALQTYFAQKERPNMRELSDALEEKFHSRGGLKHLFEALPGGPIAQGCRLAGLEPPAGAVDKSFGSVR